MTVHNCELGTDQVGMTHILQPAEDGLWEAVCGYRTGPPEYTTTATREQVSYLLAKMESGCMRCARIEQHQPSGYGGRP